MTCQPVCVASLKPIDSVELSDGLPAIEYRGVYSGNHSENAKMAEGTIKKLTEKGFGFISTDRADELFFHSSSVEGTSFEQLREGQKVSFVEGRGPKGPRAESVRPV